MRYLFLLSLLALVGCTKPLGLAVKSALNPDPEVVWDSQYRDTANLATTQMYACISEMYATGKGGGPVCREACKQYEALIKMEKDEPEFTRHLNQAPMGMPSRKVCGSAGRGTEPKP